MIQSCVPRIGKVITTFTLSLNATPNFFSKSENLINDSFSCAFSIYKFHKENRKGDSLIRWNLARFTTTKSLHLLTLPANQKRIYFISNKRLGNLSLKWQRSEVFLWGKNTSNKTCNFVMRLLDFTACRKSFHKILGMPLAWYVSLFVPCILDLDLIPFFICSWCETLIASRNAFQSFGLCGTLIFFWSATVFISRLVPVKPFWDSWSGIVSFTWFLIENNQQNMNKPIFFFFFFLFFFFFKVNFQQCLFSIHKKIHMQ